MSYKIETDEDMPNVHYIVDNNRNVIFRHVGDSEALQVLLRCLNGVDNTMKNKIDKQSNRGFAFHVFDEQLLFHSSWHSWEIAKLTSLQIEGYVYNQFYERV